LHRFLKEGLAVKPLGMIKVQVVGDVAQLVEQWTENPCVGGSIPSITTKRRKLLIVNSLRRFFLSRFGISNHARQ
jgi:hypothetical protein